MDFFQENLNLILLITGFVMVAVASSHISRLFLKLHLPIISGLLFIGILSGPYLINLIPHESIPRLSFINEIALSFIAIAAGAELYLNELRSRFNSIKWITLGQIISTFILGALAVFAVSSFVPYMRDLPLLEKVSISLLTGAVFVARSPASAIAIINELRAKGPFTQTVLGVTVIKDFIVIILFGITLNISETLISGEEFNFLATILILIELILSISLGFLFHYLLRIILKIKLEKRIKTVLILFSGYLVYQFSYFIRHLTETHLHHELFLEPLLICIIASFLITNYTRYRAEFIRIISDTGTVIYVAFFTLTGASMRLDVLVEAWLAGLLFFAIRLLTIVIGAYAGGILAGDSRKFNRVGWMPYITQAGVALGLATIIASTFPAWGPEFATVIIAVIVVNQLLGPPLIKFAIKYVGEDRTRGKAYEFDGIRDVLIFGLENQSIALGHQLSRNGWRTRIVTLNPAKKNTKIEGIEVLFFNRVSIDKLNEINAHNTEAFVMMLTDEENLEICELAYQYYGTNVMVVRLNNRINFEKFHKLGALIVEPATALVSLLDHFVRSPQATSLLLGLQKDQDTRDLEVLNPNLHGVYLRNLRLPPDVIVLSVKRGGQMIISHGYTRLRRNDIVTFVGSIESLDNVSLRFGK
jgi:Trk K+ transport system NAD-binding subunit/Kef-type K+ transport system membrane component KefB